jgi:hypothetical protein
MILLHNHLTHSGATNPIVEFEGVFVAVVVAKDSKSSNQKIFSATIRKVVPLAAMPVIGDAAKERSLKFVYRPKWFDSYDFAVRKPSSCLA